MSTRVLIDEKQLFFGGAPGAPLPILFTEKLLQESCNTSLFGYRTLKFYDIDPVKHEKHLLIEYGLVTLGAYGAGFAESSIGILTKFMFKAETGAFKVYPKYYS